LRLQLPTPLPSPFVPSAKVKQGELEEYCDNDFLKRVWTEPNRHISFLVSDIC